MNQILCGQIFLILVLSALLMFSCKRKSTEPSPPQVTLPVQLTTTGGFSYHPTASPDRQWVVFETPFGLYKIKPDGTQLDSITSAVGNPDWSDWSRKGSLIVFGTVGTVDANTGDIQVVRYNDDCYEDYPVWSPDGSQIAVTSRCPDRIVLISYPGGDTSSVPCVEPNGYTCDGEHPTWSPDGNWLAFEDGLQILKVPRAGGTAQVVYDGDADSKDVTEPAWSPDGKWIAFVREDSFFVDSMFNFVYYDHIWVADARGASFGLRQVTTGPFSDRSPAWSPDSRFIYFESNRSGSYYDSEIWKVGFNP